MGLDRLPWEMDCKNGDLQCRGRIRRRRQVIELNHGLAPTTQGHHDVFTASFIACDYRLLFNTHIFSLLEDNCAKLVPPFRLFCGPTAGLVPPSQPCPYSWACLSPNKTRPDKSSPKLRRRRQKFGFNHTFTS